jgi:rubrerythrin
VVEINADSRRGGTTQGFSLVRLDLSVRVKDAKTGEEVYRLSKNDIKGLDLDFERAGRKAYQNFTKNIESELMRKLTTDLF